MSFYRTFVIVPIAIAVSAIHSSIVIIGNTLNYLAGFAHWLVTDN
jgi:hypothetical protein